MPHFAYATTNEIGNERSAIDLGVGEEVTGPIPLVVGLDDDSERLEARPEDDIVAQGRTEAKGTSRKQEKVSGDGTVAGVEVCWYSSELSAK